MNDLVLFWLVQHGVQNPPPNSYSITSDGQTGVQSIASWNVSLLGVQPTLDQLNALQPQVTIQLSAYSDYAANLANGIAITSTGAPSLSATYAIDDASQAQLFQIVSYANTLGVFPNGQSSFPYPDITGTPHTFTTTQISNLLKGMSPIIFNMQTTLAARLQGNDAAWPGQSATIP